MKFNKNYAIAITMFVVFSISYYITINQVVDSQPITPVTPASSGDLNIYNREYIEGYTLNEAALIQNARSSLNILKIEQENVYYVRAGYWRITSQFPSYRNTPDHPIMIYSVKGEFGPMFGLASPPGSNPAIPTPTPAPLTGYTLGLDAITEQVFYSTGKFMEYEAITTQMITVDYSEYLPYQLTLEADLAKQLNATPIGLNWISFPTVTPSLIPMP
jgi:hypothetical protein